MSLDQVALYNYDCYARWSDILLRSGINHIILGPIDGLRQQVGRHIADKHLVFRYLIEWESVELEALHRLVVAVVKVLGVRVDSPLACISNRTIVAWLVACDFVGLAILACLLDRTL